MPTVLTSKCPKPKLPDEGESCGATPCPETLTICGEITASSVNVSVAVVKELSCGANLTVIGHAAPALTVEQLP